MIFNDPILIILTVIHLVLLTVVMYNYFTAPLVEKGESGNIMMKISILVPARNEEKNIGRCLDSLLKQDYNNFEIIILDDNSEDGTAAIISGYIQRDRRVRLIKGALLPEGWLGKNFACSQLYSAARYNHLLFLDADVFLSEDALSSAVSLYIDKKAAMLSVFPTQIINNKFSYLIVPLMNWLLLTFLPLNKVYKSPNTKYIAANGQFILINRKVYEAAGGHKEIKQEIVEDMELAKRVKKSGFRVVTARGYKKIYCSMYNSFFESFNGFAKNFYHGFKISKAAFYLLITSIQLVFLVPLALSFIYSWYLVPASLIIIQRVFVSVMSNQPVILNILLHPFQMFVLLLTGIFSVIKTKNRTLAWKGRSI